MTDSLTLEGRQFWHVWHMRMRLSISLSIYGSLLCPWCGSWSCERICWHIFDTINNLQPYTIRSLSKERCLKPASIIYTALVVGCIGQGIHLVVDTQCHHQHIFKALVGGDCLMSLCGKLWSQQKTFLNDSYCQTQQVCQQVPGHLQDCVTAIRSIIHTAL